MLRTYGKAFHLVIIAVAVLTVLVFLIIGQADKKPTILIVTRSQSETASLNPSRLLSAAPIALSIYSAATGNPSGIRQQYLIYTGDESDGFAAARDYLESDNSVVALVGDYNSESTGNLASLAAEFQLPLLSFMATDETIFQNNPWSFSYRPKVSSEIELMIRMTRQLSPLGSVVILASEQQNLLARAEEFNSSCKQEGIEVLTYSRYQQSSYNFYEEIDQLKPLSSDFDLIVSFLGSDQLEHLLQQLMLKDFEVTTFSTGVVIHPDLLPILKGLDRSLFSFVPCHYLRSDKENKLARFNEMYRLKLGLHRIDTIGPSIFDGLWTLYEYVEQGKRGDSLREAIQNHDLDRHVGRVAFDQDGLSLNDVFQPVRIEAGMFHEEDIP